MAESGVDFVLEKIMKILNSESQLIHFDQDQLQSVYEGLRFLRQFLGDSEGKRIDETTEDEAAKIRDVAWKADDTIDLVLLNTDDYRLRLNMSEELEGASNGDGVSAKAGCFWPKTMQIQLYEMFSWFSRRVAGGIRGLLHDAVNAFENLKRGLAQINDLPSSLSSHIASGNHILEEIHSMRTEVNKWFDSYDFALNTHLENEDFAISVEEIYDNLSSLYHRTTRQFHLLSDLVFNFLESVCLAAKISDCSDSSRLKMAGICGETLSRLKRHSQAFEDSDAGIGRHVKELESLKTEMKICKRHWSRLVEGVSSRGEKFSSVKREMGIYKTGTSRLLWNQFYETMLRKMQFIKTMSCGRFPKLHSNVAYCLSHSDFNLAEGMFFYYDRSMEAAETEEHEFFSRVHSFIADKFSFLFDFFESPGQIDGTCEPLVKHIKLIKKKLEINQGKSSLKWPVSQKAKDLLRLVYLAHRISHIFCVFRSGVPGRSYNVTLVDKIHHDFASFMEETISVMRELVISRKRWLRGENICYGFSGLMEEIKSIKAELMEIYTKMKTSDIQILPFRESSSGASSMTISPIAEEEAIVGFDDEKMMVIDFLTGEHGKQLKLIQIVGMPGLGKTTLARTVYCDPLIVHYFYICAWAYVSQVCRKRELLIRILSSAFRLGDKICEMSDEKLEEELYKGLKGKRYLIVLDDIWNIEVWNELKICFPNDSNGSRIVFTSRLEVIDVAKSHHLRFLNEDESCILLQKRVFGKESFPPELLEIGKQIATKCRGLPLAIVVLSGLLTKNEMTQHWWRHVAQSVSSYIASDQEQYMDTLALSYNHLPCHLKPCFLCFGTFPEDYEIQVWKLIWLWIAEGFISQNHCNRLEEVAEDYLMDLIGRNLVLVSKKKLNGGVKTCHVHDFLRDFCLKQAQEEKFLKQLRWGKQISSFCPITNMQRRICITSYHYDWYSWPSRITSYLKDRYFWPSCITSYHYDRYFWPSCGYFVRSFLSFDHSVDNFSMQEFR